MQKTKIFRSLEEALKNPGKVEALTKGRNFEVLIFWG